MPSHWTGPLAPRIESDSGATGLMGASYFDDEVAAHRRVAGDYVIGLDSPALTDAQ